MTWGAIGGGGGGTSSATYTVTDALVIGAATTSGVRLDLESGVLAVREGDDSDYAQMRAYSLSIYELTGASSHRTFLGSGIGGYTGATVASDAQYAFDSTVNVGGGRDAGLARDSAAQVVVTDGSTGVGNLRATALVVGTADTSGVRLEVNSGLLDVREGDDSGAADLRAANLQASDLVYCARVGFNSATVQIAPNSQGVKLSYVGNGQSTNIFQTATASSALTSGASYTFTGALPDGAIILGVTARITTTITGPTSVEIGDGTDADRYGIFSTLTSGQTLDPTGATASPLEWRSAAGDVVLTAVGGNFSAGVVRLAVHYMTCTAPTS